MAKPSERVPIDTLVDLACRDGVDIRPTLLRVLTDLYVQKPIHDADEETQYVELALGLIDAVDAQTRSAVAVSLSTYPNAPRAVLLRLAGAGAPASAGPGAHDPTAQESAADKPIEHVRSELIDLFFTAHPEERRLILRNLDVVPEPAARRTLPVAGELLRRLENAALTRNVGEFARVLERALGVSADVAARIARDNSGEPVVVAAKAIGMHPDVLARVLIFLNPIIGQSAARIYELAKLYDDMSMASAERMLAIWRTSMPPRRAHLVRQVRAVIGQGTTGRAAAPSSFAAERRVSASSSPATAPGHAPVYWNDERPDARAPSTPAAAPEPTERAAPAHPSAHAAGQARAHATAGLRTRYLTHDTVYWNDELPDARAASTPAPSRAPAEQSAPPPERRIKNK